MKIVVVPGNAPLSRELAQYCGVAFEEMGHTTEMLECRFDDRAGGAPGFLGSLARWLRRASFGSRLAQFRPELVFVVNNDQFSPADIEKLRRKAACAWAAWWIDDPALLATSRKISPAYDLFLSSDPASVETHRQVGARKADSLGYACDPGLHQPQSGERKWNVAFAGRLTSYRSEFLTPLISLGLAVWTDPRSTPIPSQGLPDSHPLRPAWRGQIGSGRDLARIYGEAKICVNVHAQKGAGISARVFEATASGALLITDERPALRELFVTEGPEAEIVTFARPAELAEKIRYYLLHEEERRAIAGRGAARCRRDHTYVLRMKRVLDLLP